MRIYAPTDCIDHENAPHHPEAPARLERLISLINADYADYLAQPPKGAPLETLPPIHDNSYIMQLIKNLEALHGDSRQEFINIDGDTALSQDSAKALTQCHAIIIEACDLILSGQEDTIFMATRPPGHHAEYDRAMGFCFINWAFMAAHIIGQQPSNRPLIIDFDVHHGNGTDDLMRRRCAAGADNIAFISLHEDPLFPGTGLQMPEQDYPQNILNIPYPPHTNGMVFHSLWDQHVTSFIKAHAPSHIILSAGFDAHMDDPLSSAQLHEDDFERITYAIKSLNIPILSVLEGGYNLDALENCVTAHLDALLDV